MSYLQSTAIPNNIYQKANHFTLYSSLFLYHLYPYLLILAFLASCLEMKRIVILIGIFSSNMTQIIIYNHSPNISFFMCILSLLFVLIAFWFIFTSKSSTFLVKSMTICDSILFGCALTWIFLTIATSIPNFDVEKIGFIVANIILAISLLAIDFQARVSFVDTAEAIKSNHIETNNEDCVGGSFVECIGGMSSGLEEKNDMNHIVPIEFKESYLYDGFRVRMNRLHGTDPSMSKTLIWTDFTNIEHKVTSTSCDIFTAIWDSAPVILKIIKIERLNSEVALSEFEMEANVLSRVHHPNIIKLLGSGVDPRPFLVLEYLQGGTLSQRMKTGNWRTGNFLQKSHTLSEALHDATALISALNYLQCEWSPHMSIIHRDIKPDNIGYSADGTLKLFDFGLSVCVKSSNKQEECYKMTGNTGTLRYMAPEVALGRPYNASVDIYSFSIIFHQILSNRVPFLRLGKKAFLKNVVENGQRPPLDPRWPIALQELLVKCWSADISVRVHSKSVQQELVNLVREESQRQFKRMDHSAMSTFRPSSINRSNNTIKFAFLVAFCVIFIVTLSFVIASSGLDVVAGSLLLISSSALYSIVLSYEPQLRRLRIFGGSLSPSLLRKATQTSKHVPVSSSEVSSTHSIDHNDPECGMSLTDTDSQKLNRNIKSQAVYGGSTFNPIVANTR